MTIGYLSLFLSIIQADLAIRGYLEGNSKSEHPLGVSQHTFHRLTVTVLQTDVQTQSSCSTHY